MIQMNVVIKTDLKISSTQATLLLRFKGHQNMAKKIRFLKCNIQNLNENYNAK